MRLATCIFLFSLVFSVQTVQAQGYPVQMDREAVPFTIGETVSLYSDILQEERMLNIYLPSTYHPDSLYQYPVIYLLDGSAEEDFIHIAGLVQFLSFPWLQIMPEAIVVGISNVDRRRDFTHPTSIEQDKIDFPTTGGSEAFLQFLGKELQPFISSRYSVDPSSETLIGQSLGGLVATEILIVQPDLFDNYIIVSPSLWWDDGSLLELTPTASTQDKSVYIVVGKEGKIMEKSAKALHKYCKARIDWTGRLDFLYLKELDHGDVLHLAAYQALQWLFSEEE